MVAITFAAGFGLAIAEVQPEHAEHEDDDRGDNPGDRRRIGVGAVEVGRDDVLDLRGAGDTGHGDGERTGGDTTGDQTLGNVCLLEQVGSERINREHDDEQADAAVSHDHAGENDCEQTIGVADFFHDGVGDRLGQTSVFHDFAEHGAEQEDGEECFDVSDCVTHKKFSVGRQDRQALQGGRQDGKDRGEHDDGESLVGNVHEADET